MALSYSETVWTNVGSTSGTGGFYKDITISPVAAGDLIVVAGIGENYLTSTTRSVTTTSGSTSSWTTAEPAVGSNADVEMIGGWATVSSGTSITVRVQLRVADIAKYFGIGAYRIPAADWDSGTAPTWTTAVADADSQISTVVGATSTVLYMFGDWAGVNPAGGTLDPAGGTADGTYWNSSKYSVAIRSWTGQAAATRTYGFTGLGAVDYSGAILVVREPGVGGQNVPATAVAATAAVQTYPTANASIVIGGASKQGIWT